MATAPTYSPDDLRVLAEALRDGGTHPFPGSELYTYEDWRSAAEYALDTEDFSEMAFMFAEEERPNYEPELPYEPSIGLQWPGNAVMGIR